VADITKALGIHGWMTQDELEWLAEQASQRSTIAEIGSYRGRSTRALAENTAGTIIAIDTWDGSSDFTPEQRAGLFEDFQRNMAGLDNVRPLRMTSLEASESLGDRQFDMIFIDAEHDYDNVKADIQAWLPRLKPGGLLCGHDYIDCYPGVLRAVGELVPGFGLAGYSIWYKEL
jgi:predicted O-methyltransferase YrrM